MVAAVAIKEQWTPGNTWLQDETKKMIRGKENEFRMPVVSGDDRAPLKNVSCTITDGKVISVARAVIKDCKEWSI